MSSRLYATPLTLDPQPSRWLLIYTIIAHVLAVAVLLPLAIPAWSIMLLFTAVLISALFTLRRDVLLVADNAIARVTWTEQDWVVELAGGPEYTTALLPGSYLGRHIIVLGFRGKRPWQHRYLVLAPDSLDSETARRLRVRLRLEA